MVLFHIIIVSNNFQGLHLNIKLHIRISEKLSLLRSIDSERRDLQLFWHQFD